MPASKTFTKETKKQKAERLFLEEYATEISKMKLVEIDNMINEIIDVVIDPKTNKKDREEAILKSKGLVRVSQDRREAFGKSLYSRHG